MISIPEPCHEDFSKMTPTERGSFCTKCKVDTFDFRNASTFAIKKVLYKYKNEHLCGQFTNHQLKEINAGFQDWKKQRSKITKSKFLFALLIVFGLSLFSCKEEDKETITALQKIELTKMNMPFCYVNTVVKDIDFDLTDYLQEVDGSKLEMDLLKEEIIVVEQKNEQIETEKSAVLDTIKDRNKTTIEMMLPDVVLKEVFIVDKSEKSQMDFELPQSTAGVPVLDGQSVARGALAPTNKFLDYLGESHSGQWIDEEFDLFTFGVDSEIITNTSYFDATAHPNPIVNNAVLSLEINTTQNFEILLFDAGGKQVLNIYSGQLEEGVRTFLLNMENEKSGMYLIKVISMNQNETIQLQKM